MEALRSLFIRLRFRFARFLDGCRVLLRLSSSESDQTDYQLLQPDGDGVEEEYRRLVASHLTRWGIDERCATVHMQALAPRGPKKVYVAVVGLIGWDRDAVIRSLLGLPLLDKKVRKSVEDSWLAEVSSFEGIQMRVCESLHGHAGADELRQLMVTLTAPSSITYTQAPARNGANLSI